MKKIPSTAKNTNKKMIFELEHKKKILNKCLKEYIFIDYLFNYKEYDILHIKNNYYIKNNIKNNNNIEFNLINNTIKENVIY